MLEFSDLLEEGHLAHDLRVTVFDDLFRVALAPVVETLSAFNADITRGEPVSRSAKVSYTTRSTSSAVQTP